MMRRGVGRVGRPGLVGTMARTAVVAGTATAVAGGVSRHQQSKYAEKDAAAMQQQQAAEQEAAAQQQAAAEQAAAQAAAEQAAAAPAEDPTITRIKELAELHSQGILSDEEFANAKAKLL